jgi:hypothetical protein
VTCKERRCERREETTGIENKITTTTTKLQSRYLVFNKKKTSHVLHIIHEPQFDETVCLVSFAQIVQVQSLHGQGFAMIWKLFQDGICQLDGLFVLLVLVVLDDIFEEIRFLFGQGLTSSALGIGLGVVVGRHDDEMIGGVSSVSVGVDRGI